MGMSIDKAWHDSLARKIEDLRCRANKVGDKAIVANHDELSRGDCKSLRPRPIGIDGDYVCLSYDQVSRSGGCERHAGESEDDSAGEWDVHLTGEYFPKRRELATAREGPKYQNTETPKYRKKCEAGIIPWPDSFGRVRAIVFLA
jgi:hypothetical protein